MPSVRATHARRMQKDQLRVAHTTPPSRSGRQASSPKMRWRIERDYQELKQEIGRAWALRRARMAWLPSSRNALHRGLWVPGLRTSRDSSGLRPPARLSTPALPDGYRPRGSALAA